MSVETTRKINFEKEFKQLARLSFSKDKTTSIWYNFIFHLFAF